MGGSVGTGGLPRADVRCYAVRGPIPCAAALEVLTLRKLFHTVLSYCLRYFNTLSELSRQQQLQLAGAGVSGAAPAGLDCPHAPVPHEAWAWCRAAHSDLFPPLPRQLIAHAWLGLAVTIPAPLSISRPRRALPARWARPRRPSWSPQRPTSCAPSCAC